jgi:pyruvate formate lyase activating enzyme
MAPPEGNDAGAATLRIDREQCTACAQCVAFCPDGAFEIFGRAIGVDELLDLLIRDQPYYEEKSGGVTLSGGEPLAQADAVLALLRSLNRAAIHVALRTCGMAPSKALNKALDHVDLVLFELSLVDAARHGRLTGIPFGSVEEAARLVNASGVPVWVRTPVVAGYTDDEEDIRRLGEFVAQTFEHCERHELRAFSNRCTAKYHRLGRTAPLGATDELSAETMRRLCAIAREAGSLHAHWAGPMVA